MNDNEQEQVHKNHIKGILRQIKGDYFDYEENLITDGYISSFDLIELIAEMEKVFDIKIPLEEIRPEELNNVSGICEVVLRHSKAGMA